MASQAVRSDPRQPADDRQVGARSIGDDDRKKGGGWWKWLLGLLLLLAVIGLLVALLSGGDDKKKSASAPTTSAAAPTTSAAPATGAAPTTAATPAPTGDGGMLTASGASLLPVPADGLKSYVGKPATGTGDKVLSVTESGFFVGTSNADRVFVEYGNKVGGDESSQTYKAKVGDTVDLTGPVRPAPEDPAKTLKLDAADAATVTEQGGYVNADTVKASS